MFSKLISIKHKDEGYSMPQSVIALYWTNVFYEWANKAVLRTLGAAVYLPIFKKTLHQCVYVRKCEYGFLFLRVGITLGFRFGKKTHPYMHFSYAFLPVGKQELLFTDEEFADQTEFKTVKEFAAHRLAILREKKDA